MGGGGLDWFDPLTLIRAVAQLSVTRQRLRLVFMGLQHPNPRVPEMEMARRAVALADELGLTGRVVFFNFGWIPYEDRQNWLLDADVGVSMHFDHLETRFSFRTRILDYFWAGLPVVCTEGDSMAELVVERGAGIAVPFEDVRALAVGLDGLLEDDEARAVAKASLQVLRDEYRWSVVTQPVLRILEGFAVAPTDGLSWRQASRSANLLMQMVRNAYVMNGAGAAASTVLRRLQKLPRGPSR